MGSKNPRGGWAPISLENLFDVELIVAELVAGIKFSEISAIGWAPISLENVSDVERTVAVLVAAFWLGTKAAADVRSVATMKDFILRVRMQKL